MTVPLISVVLCTHNPRPAYLAATVSALQGQDCPIDLWELILVDNASESDPFAVLDLSWHPHLKVINEPRVGLAQARRTAYQAAGGELIIHSDDDNLFAPNYLREAWRIYHEYPHIGSYGGQWIAKYEVEPRTEQERNFGFDRRFEKDAWSNVFDDPRTMPFGAGMCLRRSVIDAYLQRVEADPRRLRLGRSGQIFFTGEDIDLNHVAVEIGKGTGIFPILTFEHLVPVERMTAAHMIKYGAGNAYSMVILHFLRDGQLHVPRRSWLGWLRHWTSVLLRKNSFDRRMEIAVQKARRQAIGEIQRGLWS